MDDPAQTRKIELLAAKRARQGGQAIVEYILLLTIILGTVTYFLKTLTHSFDVGTAKVGAKLEKQIRTGSISVSAWSK